MILRAAALQPPDYAGYIDRSWDQRRVELGNSLTSFCFTWPALVASRAVFCGARQSNAIFRRCPPLPFLVLNFQIVQTRLWKRHLRHYGGMKAIAAMVMILAVFLAYAR